MSRGGSSRNWPICDSPPLAGRAPARRRPRGRQTAATRARGSAARARLPRSPRRRLGARARGQTWRCAGAWDVILPAMNEIEFLRRLRTVRDFTSEPMPEDALRDILEVGRWTGTANNRQPAEIIVVRDAEKRQRLTEYGANTATKAAAALVIVTAGDKERAEHEMFDEGRIAERLQLAAAAHRLGAG